MITLADILTRLENENNDLDNITLETIEESFNDLTHEEIDVKHYKVMKKCIEVLNGNRDNYILRTLLAVRFSNGSSLLHDAAKKGDLQLVKLLIENGANVNAQDQNGKIPLHYTAEKGYRAIADLMIENGANVNAKDQDGKIPLHYAAESGDKVTVDLMINNIEGYSRDSNIDR